MVPHRFFPDRMPPDLADEIIAAGHQAVDVRHYLIWSRYPITRVEPTRNGWRVRVEDARYDARGGAGSLSGVETIVGEEDLTGGTGRGP
jgi:hypothetical protein